MVEWIVVKEGKDRISAFRERAGEKWKADHEDAMACRDFEDRLFLGVQAYDFIDAIDTRARLAVARKKVEYDPSVHEAIEKLFGLWWAAARGLENRIREFEERGFEVDLADEFRKRCGWAKAAEAERR